MGGIAQDCRKHSPQRGGRTAQCAEGVGKEALRTVVASTSGASSGDRRSAAISSAAACMTAASRDAVTSGRNMPGEGVGRCARRAGQTRPTAVPCSSPRPGQDVDADYSSSTIPCSPRGLTLDTTPTHEIGLLLGQVAVLVLRFDDLGSYPQRVSRVTIAMTRLGATSRQRAWTRPLAWLVMATGTSRRGKREMARPNGSAQRSKRARTEFRHGAVALVPGWWLAGAVVAGLFAMHGLGMHGIHSGEASSPMHAESSSTTSGMAALPESPPDLSATGMSAAGHDDSGAEGAGTQPADLNAAFLGSATDTSPEPSGGAGLVGLCLTLLAFGALWLRRLTRGRPAWTIPRRALVARVARLPVTARALSPPLRAELSIWRC